MLTQADAAAAAHVARTAIIRLERGGGARGSTIRNLADTLSVTPADLMASRPRPRDRHVVV